MNSRRLICSPSGRGPTAYHMLNESCVVLDRGMIEIEFAAGARMRITGAVDANALTAAVAVLAEGRRR